MAVITATTAATAQHSSSYRVARAYLKTFTDEFHKIGAHLHK